MRLKKFVLTVGFALAVVVLGFNSDVFAQGRGRGGGRPTVNPSVNRPTNNGNGNIDRDFPTTSRRLDDSMNRPRTSGGRRDLPSDNEINRYRGISRKLDTTPETMRAQYEAALKANPDLKFGQFVAANVIADNLGSRNSNITAAAILAGLRRGDSIGQTLRELGLSPDEAKQAEKDAKRQIKESRKKQ